MKAVITWMPVDRAIQGITRYGPIQDYPVSDVREKFDGSKVA